MTSLFGISDIKPRPSQELIASTVRSAIAANSMLLVQASPGIGKSLAYLAPALQSGRRTVVSVPTRQLQNQIVREVERLGYPAVLRVGMENFFSASRINRILADLQSDQKNNATLIQQLRAARSFNGSIEDFVDEFGELLIERSLICLRSSSAASDRHAYDEQNKTARDAMLVVQTHALTLLEIRFGRHDADITIFDEAHTLPSLAASSVEARVSLDEVGLDHLADNLGANAFVLLDDGMRQQIIDAREQVEDADLKAQLTRILAPIRSLKQGVGIVAKPIPTLQRVSVDPARFIGPSLRGRPAIFVSATLNPVEQFKAALGLPELQLQDFKISKFGTMTITLADRQVALPFADGQPNDSFFDYAASMVRATKGNTLILTASYDDVERLAVRVAGLIKHERGEPLGSLIQRFKAEGGKLITPAAWEGLDLPHFIEDLVIVRLPLAPVSELRQTVMETMLGARGYDKAAAKHILQAQARANSLRRMSQGIGRGIRAPDDKVRLWIADPRFPLPAAMVRDPRRMLSQGAAMNFRDFASTIPPRFREGVRSAFDSAAVFSSGSGENMP